MMTMRYISFTPSFPLAYLKFQLQIINNYAGQGNDTQRPFQNASDAFNLYNADPNYDPRTKDDVNYYDFRYGDVAFFVMDTRRYRSKPEEGSVATRTMLGEKQLNALYDWLGKVCVLRSIMMCDWDHLRYTI